MENFRIESLEINKIGAFEHIKMDFPKKTDPDKAEIHILTGENGTGKTTLLHLLTHCVPFEEKWLAEKFEYNATQYSFFNIDGHFMGEHIKIKGSKAYFDNTFNSFDEKYIKQRFKNLADIPPDILYYPNNGIFYFSLFAYSGYRRISEINLEGIKPINSHPLENALDFDKSINPNLFVQWVANSKAKSALSFMRLMQSNKFEESFESIGKYEETLGLIESAISEITEHSIQFILEESPFEVKISIDRKENVPFEHLPDGLKSIISWIGDLLMRLDSIDWENDKTPINEQNFILFLDEIEVHLHPAWQRKILPVVQKLFKNAQIFISTHSPFVVGSVDGAWVHKLKKDGAYAVLDGEPILSEDAKSYDTILEEIFDVKERFGVQVEDDLKKFYQFKAKILGEEDFDIEPFLDLVSKLASESIELESMLGMELKQIKRLTGKDFLATA